jgi:hypothetical protein
MPVSGMRPVRILANHKISLHNVSFVRAISNNVKLYVLPPSIFIICFTSENFVHESCGCSYGRMRIGGAGGKWDVV